MVRFVPLLHVLHTFQKYINSPHACLASPLDGNDESRQFESITKEKGTAGMRMLWARIAFLLLIVGHIGASAQQVPSVVDAAPGTDGSAIRRFTIDRKSVV